MPRLRWILVQQYFLHCPQLKALGLVAVDGEKRADIWEDAFWFQDENCQFTQVSDEVEKYEIFDGDTDEEDVGKNHMV